MPKITIKTLPVQAGADIPGLLKKLGHTLSAALDLPLKRLVILWEIILPNHFLFDGRLAPSQPFSTHHPIVEIAALEGMPREMEKQMVQTIAQQLAQGLSIDSDNICLVITPIQTGNLFVSGKSPEKPPEK